jgi:hypothetical protein
MKAVVVTFIVLIGMTASGADSDPTVTVTGGRVRGTVLVKDGAVFKGIRHSVSLRFQKPLGDNSGAMLMRSDRDLNEHPGALSSALWER